MYMGVHYRKMYKENKDSIYSNPKEKVFSKEKVDIVI